MSSGGIIILRADGRQEIQPDSITLAQATEPILQGDLVNTYPSGGVRSVRKASANAIYTILGIPTRTANGFAMDAAPTGTEVIRIQEPDAENSNAKSTSNPLVIIDIGMPVYLSEITPGEVTVISPTGVQDEVSQPVGIVDDITTISWQRGIPIKINV